MSKNKKEKIENNIDIHKCEKSNTLISKIKNNIYNYINKIYIVLIIIFFSYYIFTGLIEKIVNLNIYIYIFGVIPILFSFLIFANNNNCCCHCEFKNRKNIFSEFNIKIFSIFISILMFTFAGDFKFSNKILSNRPVRINQKLSLNLFNNLKNIDRKENEKTNNKIKNTAIEKEKIRNAKYDIDLSYLLGMSFNEKDNDFFNKFDISEISIDNSVVPYINNSIYLILKEGGIKTELDEILKSKNYKIRGKINVLGIYFIQLDKNYSFEEITKITEEFFTTGKYEMVKYIKPISSMVIDYKILNDTEDNKYMKEVTESLGFENNNIKTLDNNKKISEEELKDVIEKNRKLNENKEPIILNKDTYILQLEEIFNKQEEYIGRKIIASGKIFKMPETNKIKNIDYGLGYIYMYCCAADMSWIGLNIQKNLNNNDTNYLNKNIEENKWYNIEGIIDGEIIKTNSEIELIHNIKITQLNEINEPKDIVVK